MNASPTFSQSTEDISNGSIFTNTSFTGRYPTIGSTSFENHLKPINVDPPKRCYNRGLKLKDFDEHGIDIKNLDPHVVRRVRNTEAARRSRSRKQQHMNMLEERLEAQKQQIEALSDELGWLRRELTFYKAQMITKNNDETRKWLGSSYGMNIPKNLR